MSKPISEELLSAYLDGELSPEERAHVEHLLRECNLHRDCLEDLIELSQTLRALPCCSAPGELRDFVLGRLHDSTSVWRGNASALPPWRWNRLSSLLAACVVLTVGIWSFSRIDQPQRAELAEAPQLAASPKMRAAQLLKSAMAPQPATVHRAANAPAQLVGMDKDQLRLKVLELGWPPVPGDSIRMDLNAEVVVEFTVVDVQEVFDQLQVLLKQRQLQRSGRSDSQLSQIGNAYPMQVLGLELEGLDRDVVDILNRVPALDAIAFIEDPTAVPVCPRPQAEQMILPEVASDLPLARRGAASGAETFLVNGPLPRVYRFNDLPERRMRRSQGEQNFGEASLVPPEVAAQGTMSTFGIPAGADLAARSQPFVSTEPAPTAVQNPEAAMQRLRALIMLRQSPPPPPQRIPEE